METSKETEAVSDAHLHYLQLLIDNGYKIKFMTQFYGKDYVWMTSPSGSYFLERLPEETDA